MGLVEHREVLSLEEDAGDVVKGSLAVRRVRGRVVRGRLGALGGGWDRAHQRLGRKGCHRLRSEDVAHVREELKQIQSSAFWSENPRRFRRRGRTWFTSSTDGVWDICCDTAGGAEYGPLLNADDGGTVMDKLRAG